MEEWIAKMLMALEGQSNFLPCGVPYWGSTISITEEVRPCLTIIISAWITTNPIAISSFRTGGRTLRSGRGKNDRHSIAAFLDRYKDNSHAVVEATRNWMVIYDWLDAICDDVVLAHPLKVKAIADAKIKTDKIAATVLAHLLRADLVPEAWAPSERARELRVALRERIFYVRLRTTVKNRIVTIFDRYPEQTVQLRKARRPVRQGRPRATDSADRLADRPHPDRPRHRLHRRHQCADQTIGSDDPGDDARERQCEAAEDHSQYRRVLRPADRRRDRRCRPFPLPDCATSALTSGAAPACRNARPRYPDCPDGCLASLAAPGCAPNGEWEAGSRTPLCDRSQRDNGIRVTDWRMVQKPRDGTCPAHRKDLADRPSSAGQNATGPRKSAQQDRTHPLSSFIGESDHDVGERGTSHHGERSGH